VLFTDLSSERVVRALMKAGYRVVSQGKHIGLSNGERRLTLPRHPRLNPYTLKAIIRDAGLSDAEFKRLL
jgi:predicted RNA binding protein YcfA (HicA-like mRNA interferase family)